MAIMGGLPPGFCAGADQEAGWKAGAASIDITPAYPVRLSGYGSRTTEHEGVAMPIHAKALALTWQDEEPVVIVTVDNCGVPEAVRSEVLSRLAKAGKTIDSSRLSLHSSHTHCAPMLRGVLPFLFPISATEQRTIDRYTEELTGKIAGVVAKALAAQEPAAVDRSIGEVTFASNRRFKTPANTFINSPNPYGPVDHALPVLRVKGRNDKLIAVFTSYACHCTTLSINQIHPDWAGCAQAELELRFPGAVAMTAIGCGGDQNPYPRREMRYVTEHGVGLAKEVVRLINLPMQSVAGPVACANRQIELPFDTLPDRAAWQKMTEDKTAAIALRAKHFLGLMDAGKPIPASLPYTVQVWSFDNDLLTINLPGEVVVDYSLRFKKQFGAGRTWVNAYTNDVPCYIPSQRVWEEGGYEAAGAMPYYGRPARFASGIEGIIAGAVGELVPGHYRKAGGAE